MQEVLRQSGGRYNLGPGTLYDNLQRLMKQRMVEEVSGPREAENFRRRCYRQEIARGATESSGCVTTGVECKESTQDENNTTRGHVFEVCDRCLSRLPMS
jgi:hypothetical protein